MKKMLIALGILMLCGIAIVLAWPRYIWPKIVVHVMANIAMPKYGLILPKTAVANVAREYPPQFNSATPSEAGRALHALVKWHPDPPAMASVLLPYDRDRDSKVKSLPDSNPLHIPPPLWCQGIIALAAKGFSAEQKSFLERAIDDPDLRTLLFIGGAREMDVLGTRFTFEPRSELYFLRTLPIPFESSVKHASELACASAAHHFAGGDTAGAEALLRTAANAGVLMIDDGPSPIDILVGAVVARQSMTALAALYEVTGRHAEGEKITRDLAASAAKTFPPMLTATDQNTIDLRKNLPSIAASTDVPPGLKWEYLIAIGTLNRTAFCVGEFAYDSAYDSWRAAVRASLVKRESDSAFFEWLTTAPASKANCAQEQPPTSGNGVAQAAGRSMGPPGL